MAKLERLCCRLFALSLHVDSFPSVQLAALFGVIFIVSDLNDLHLVIFVNLVQCGENGVCVCVREKERETVCVCKRERECA